ncbi:uncharacterized protein MYCFIDRAFT_83279 [Pseudocercospora fijiensis CIRAD86]|uniref:RNase III domain-containing protein n=1 Tax=Pseudocercospora fijiensis (strain CIRAD86) TaxID=383855 RepID=M3AJJ9_PSEFD|nr:uncharacterized protein MYCFIDRAFT_83279 [Pseudocercospora fijiensis CIRAD86]EME77338.1 hypothetical protein MYCFIDRAFT_83279 [Pseudocercospora fijiensis CIRAD86]
MASRLENAKTFIEHLTGHKFTNSNLLIEALDTTGQRARESNRRLALLGDKLMVHIIADGWYASNAPLVRGQTLLERICGNDNLATVGFNIGLDAHVVVHPGQRGAVSRKTMATTVEAVVGAIYVDSGKDIETVKDAMVCIGLNPSGV